MEERGSGASKRTHLREKPQRGGLAAAGFGGRGWGEGRGSKGAGPDRGYPGPSTLAALESF